MANNKRFSNAWRYMKMSWALRRRGAADPRRFQLALEIAAMGNVLSNWRSEGAREFRGMRLDWEAWALSCDGLASFFLACESAGASASTALPSSAADSVWHSWLRVDSVGLDEFCLRNFGRPINHAPAEELPGGMAAGLAQCWREVILQEKGCLANGGLPSLFALDDLLDFPSGFSHQRQGKTWEVTRTRRQKAPESAKKAQAARSRRRGDSGGGDGMGLAAIGSAGSDGGGDGGSDGGGCGGCGGD